MLLAFLYAVQCNEVIPRHTIGTLASERVYYDTTTISGKFIYIYVNDNNYNYYSVQNTHQLQATAGFSSIFYSFLALNMDYYTNLDLNIIANFNEGSNTRYSIFTLIPDDVCSTFYYSSHPTDHFIQSADDIGHWGDTICYFNFFDDQFTWSADLNFTSTDATAGIQVCYFNKTCGDLITGESRIINQTVSGKMPYFKFKIPLKAKSQFNIMDLFIQRETTDTSNRFFNTFDSYQPDEASKLYTGAWFDSSAANTRPIKYGDFPLVYVTPEPTPEQTEVITPDQSSFPEQTAVIIPDQTPEPTPEATPEETENIPNEIEPTPPKKDLPLAAIIGGAVGGVALIVIIVVVVVCIQKRKKLKEVEANTPDLDDEQEELETDNENDSTPTNADPENPGTEIDEQRAISRTEPRVNADPEPNIQNEESINNNGNIAPEDEKQNPALEDDAFGPLLNEMDQMVEPDGENNLLMPLESDFGDTDAYPIPDVHDLEIHH
ncbi:hypothetical protein TRFO_11878 [Tritrichomonas foetus]|uniref:Uncharacterized protein n=1 Tax=Tritrichomonas foetus TaxID=1144522 RepID=A0A1J4J158_9EUKA|nr:hypothetical protein TRFO_11878 [Tritrichomonas foetus]|eukprot:OHS93272.1 hypothetical protein TRFO_11878 [Tritrichomonas foetus]